MTAEDHVQMRMIAGRIRDFFLRKNIGMNFERYFVGSLFSSFDFSLAPQVRVAEVEALLQNLQREERFLRLQFWPIVAETNYVRFMV